jgi:CBS domain containing-hemolysin-like protein
MIVYILSCILLLAGLTALALQRFYSSVPAWELKRLAGRGDHLARSLYRVAAYGQDLRLLLWSAAVLALSGGYLLVVLYAIAMPVVSFAVLVIVSAAAFVVLPSLQLTQRSARFAVLLSSPLSRTLLHLHGVLEKAGNLLNRYRHFEAHTGVYEKDDLVSLLIRQKEQSGNRMSPHDLERTERALVFTDRKVLDVLKPRKEAYLVDGDETIGPILLDTLHKQHQSSFLVYKGDKEDIVGSLTLSDAINAKHGGRVLDLIRNDVTFVNEDFDLGQALRALRQTNQVVAVVINNFEEFVGVLTLDMVLQELLGDIQEEELSYANRSAIAAYQPKKETPAEAVLDKSSPSEEDLVEEPANDGTDEVTEVGTSP